MDVAAMSIQMSSAQLHQQVSVAVLDMALDTAGELAQDMVTELMVEAPVGAEGANIDISI